MTAEERIACLEAQLSQVLEQLEQTQEELRQAHEQLAVANIRIEELEKQKPQDGEKQPRKKRDPKHNRARRRKKPTRIVEHRISTCPRCSSRLGRVSVAPRRPVIELPPPPPIEVTEHVVSHGWCRKSGTWPEAPLDVSREVIGQGRMGVKLTRMIVYLRTVMREPSRQIQAYLATLHGLKISSGEIVELLHRAKGQLQPLGAARVSADSGQPSGASPMKRVGEKMGRMAPSGA